MLRALSTVAFIGCIPVFGRFLASLAGVVLACAIFAITGTPEAVFGIWAVCLILTGLVLPRAIAAGYPPREVVIDRFVGVWLAIAPAIPLVTMMARGEILFGLIGLGVPLILYNLLLAGPLRRMGSSERLLFRIGDDLLAGIVTLMVCVGTMVVLFSMIGGSA